MPYLRPMCGALFPPTFVGAMNQSEQETQKRLRALKQLVDEFVGEIVFAGAIALIVLLVSAIGLV
jgi:hypothetical protein